MRLAKFSSLAAAAIGDTFESMFDKSIEEMGDKMADDLVRLGRLLEKRIAKFQRGRSVSQWTDEELSTELAGFAELENRIISAPADSLAGLGVKARLVRWLLDDRSPTPTGESTEERLICSIMRDMLKVTATIEVKQKRAARPQVSFFDRVG